jgi:aminoglycoside 3-N-acetyltransferase
MVIKDFARALVLHHLPETLKRRLKSVQLDRRRAKLVAFPATTEAEFRAFASESLGIAAGRVVFVHSSVDLLHVSFTPLRLLQLLQELVGPGGTLVFPSFPLEGMCDVLRSGRVFDVRRTPGGTGLLGELARRTRGARRSLHPVRSVVAIGPLAEVLVAHHHENPFPFSATSPFALHATSGGLVVGLGVSTKNLTLVHVLDDAHPGKLPVSPYAPELFPAPCRDAEGRDVVVPTYAHDQRRMRFDVPRFVRRHFEPSVAVDLTWRGMDYFRVEAGQFFRGLVDLAERGITIYRDRR